MDQQAKKTAARYSPSDRVLGQIERSFHYHPPTSSDQVDRYQEIRREAWAFAKTIALTKLEESVMHANAAIARNEVAS